MADELEYLRRAVALKRAAVVVAREAMIEALGDRMCGCGKGPSPQDIQTFKLALQAEAEAKERLERYLVARSQEVIDQARRAGTGRPSAPLDQHRGNGERHGRRQTVMKRQPAERGRPD